MKKISLILLAVASLSFGACKFRSSTPNNPSVDVSDVTISLSTNSIALMTGESQKIEVNLSRQVSYSFSSSDEKVATVTPEGLVKAINKGDCLIRAYLNDDPSIKAMCSVTVVDDSSLMTTTINSISRGTDYQTNFFYQYYNGTKIFYYRLAGTSATPSNTMALIYASGNLKDNADDNPYLPGSVYNETAMMGIRRIIVNYRGEGNIRYGADRDMPNSVTLPNHSSMSEEISNFPANTNYFAIEATQNLYINSITVKYLTGGPESSVEYTYNGERVAPSRCLNPSEGQSASMPVMATKTSNGKSYQIQQTKTYTYYSSSYVINNGLSASGTAYIDPIDIANYYYLFGSVPPNFGYNSSFDPEASYSNVISRSSILSYYGYDLARSVATYTRIDGYANAVPYNAHGSSYYPLYIEFDVALHDDYTIYNRDVGRVVTWIDGFSCYSDSAPISTFTGDHYLSFWEYNNMGGWNHPFDGSENETRRTCYNHSPATTYDITY